MEANGSGQATRDAIQGSALPSELTASLTVRIGEPRGNSRSGWKRDVKFSIEEGYDGFRAKCSTKLTKVAVSSEVAKRKKKHIELRDNSDVYLKRLNNEGQDKYMGLSSANFVESLERRWRLLKPSDKAPDGQFRFLCFLYVANVMPPPSSSADFHRATEKRIQQARLQRLTHEAANSVRFGAITAHHLDIVNARRPDSASFHVPEDNSTAQAMELDRQREDIERECAQDTEQASARTVVIKILWIGVWVPVVVDLLSLRRALGLPDHNLFSAGIFHDFTPNQPTYPNMEDEEHKDHGEPMDASMDSEEDAVGVSL